MIGVIMTAISVPQIAMGFKEESQYEKSESIPVQGQIVYLNINEVGMDDYDGVDLRIRPTEKEDMLLEYEFSAKGPNRNEATENAKEIGYSWKWESDSVMVFDSNIKLPADAVFRDQKVLMTLFMPIGQKFVLPHDIESIIYHTVYHYGYDLGDLDEGNTFYFSDMETLECDGCSPESGKYTGSNHKEIYFNSPFTSVNISGTFNIVYQQDTENSLRIEGAEEYISEVEVVSNEDELNISFEKASYRNMGSRKESPCSFPVQT